ncbi:hypothetical protein QVA66_08320 [Staphylococcus chromogenes]|nr:hypothetical protein [Staphylococcus chromogenes]
MTTFSPQRSHADVQTASTAVLEIDGLPRSLRLAVEQLMVDCIRSESELFVPGADPLTANWCTRWSRSATNPRTIACRQVLTGTTAELELFDDTLAAFARAKGFAAEVRIVD